eukprot:3766533-Rhodomonas_salina.2
MEANLCIALVKSDEDIEKRSFFYNLFKVSKVDDSMCSCFPEDTIVSGHPGTLVYPCVPGYRASYY